MICLSGQKTHFLLGYINYDSANFIQGQYHYEVAFNDFMKCGYSNKAALAKYNVAQCLYQLGSIEECYKIEKEVFNLAEELELYNIKGLCLRSLAYRNVKDGNLPEGLRYFRMALKILSNISNDSDASLCRLYVMAIEISIGSTDRISAQNLLMKEDYVCNNERVVCFKNYLIKYLENSSKNTLQKILDSCNTDIQFVLSHLSLSEGLKKSSANKGRISKAEKLIKYIKNPQRSTSRRMCSLFVGQ